jgi:hypothetical protein
VGAEDVGAFGFFVEEVVHLREGAVESDHGESVVVHIQNQILAHNGQPNHGNISFRFHVVSFYWNGERYKRAGNSPVDS